jgi:MoaA/NifB/PqqE/SkfB family radical SAM enzyme
MNFQENKALNRREIEERKTVLASKVTSLVVTLTTRCNIVCRMCEEYKIPWDMPQGVIDEIVALMPYLEQVIWQGGEVLLLDYFKDVLLEAACANPNLHQSIITNGLPIDAKTAEKLVRENMELTFSIDGPTKESYEYVRRGASFDRLIDNIAMIHELKKKKQPKNMTIRMHAVVMRSNYRELERFIEFAHTYAFDALHLMPIWGNLDSEENIFHRQDKEALDYLRLHIGAAERQAASCGLNLLNSLPFSSEPGGRSESEKKGPEGGNCDLQAAGNGKKLLCHMPWRRMVINPAGNVCPACHCHAMIGNVLNGGLAALWNNETMQLYRRNIIEGTCGGFCNPSCVSGIIAEELRGLE